MMNNIPSRIGENCTNTTSADEKGKLPPAFGRIQRSSDAKWKIVYRAPRCMHRSRCLRYSYSLPKLKLTVGLQICAIQARKASLIGLKCKLIENISHDEMSLFISWWGHQVCFLHFLEITFICLWWWELAPTPGSCVVL